MSTARACVQVLAPTELITWGGQGVDPRMGKPTGRALGRIPPGLNRRGNRENANHHEGACMVGDPSSWRWGCAGGLVDTAALAVWILNSGFPWPLWWQCGLIPMRALMGVRTCNHTRARRADLPGDDGCEAGGS